MNGDEVSSFSGMENDTSVHEGEESVVPSATHPFTGMEFRAPLAHDDRPRAHQLAGETLDAEPLGLRIAAVLRRTAFFPTHGTRPLSLQGAPVLRNPHSDLPGVLPLEIAQSPQEELRHPPEPAGRDTLRPPRKNDAHLPGTARVSVLDDAALRAQPRGRSQQGSDRGARDVALHGPLRVSRCPEAAEQPFGRKVEKDVDHRGVSRGR
jgi:hypothetical protein